MSNKLEPVNPIINNPRNLDRIIQDAQNALKDNLSWLDNSFGICETAWKRSGEKEYSYPEVFTNNDGRRYVQLEPNRDFKNFSFFNVHDPTDYIDYVPLQQVTKLKNNVDLIFWLNFEKINIPNNPKFHYRFYQPLINDIHFALNTISDIKIIKHYKEFNQVWGDWILIHDETTQQYFKQPNAGLKFNLEIEYTADCVTEFTDFNL